MEGVGLNAAADRVRSIGNNRLFDDDIDDGERKSLHKLYLISAVVLCL